MKTVFAAMSLVALAVGAASARDCIDPSAPVCEIARAGEQQLEQIDQYTEEERKQMGENKLQQLERSKQNLREQERRLDWHMREGIASGAANNRAVRRGSPKSESELGYARSRSELGLDRSESEMGR
jgi:hypothetical protein